MHIGKVLGLLAATLFAASVGRVDAALPGGISGHWYNPDQAGHGVALTLVDGGRSVLIWQVYDRAGQPLTLYVDGSLSGRQLRGPAYAPRGMQFGAFDPAALQLPVWGEVSLSFSSCTRAVLSWNAVDPAFGSGAIALQRLAAVDAADCKLPPVDLLPMGLYRGHFETDRSETGGYGVVDREGRLWGVERHANGGVNRLAHAVRLDPTARRGPSLAASGITGALAWRDGGRAQATSSGGWRIDSEPLGGRFVADVEGVHFTHSWTPAADNDAQLVRPLDPAVLAGHYMSTVSDPATLTIADDGALCVAIAGTARCMLSGRLTTSEGDIGLLDFELRHVDHPTRAPYRGRGWLVEFADGARELMLVGDDGHTAFGLIGR